MRKIIHSLKIQQQAVHGMRKADMK